MYSVKSQMISPSLQLALGAALLCSGGCGGGDDGRPTRYPVTGVVTHQGQPVDAATIMFVTPDGTRGAAGRTDAQGRYTLTTFEPGDGALPGEYLVTVSKLEIPTEFPDEEDEEQAPRDEERLPPPANLLPANYAGPQTSGLSATVVEGKNTFDFHLD